MNGIAHHPKGSRLQTTSVGAKPTVCKQWSDVISSAFLKNEWDKNWGKILKHVHNESSLAELSQVRGNMVEIFSM